MTRRLLGAAGLAVMIGAGIAGTAIALDGAFVSKGEAGTALGDAERALASARSRATRLDQDARAATEAADHTAREAAATAARIQQAEAEIALAHAQIAVIERERSDLRARIANRQAPLVRLTAALQMIARRPLAFSMVRAQSLRETIWLRATLATMVPQVADRTAALRAEIAHGRQLQDQARSLASGLMQSQRDLGTKQQELVTIESRQRIASRAASGNAARESDRVLALAETTRDLGSLVTRLAQDEALAARLSALPGPLPRPRGITAVAPAPGALLMVDHDPPTGPLAGAVSGQAPGGTPLLRFVGVLPVAGRLISGFGEASATGPQHGIVLAPPGGAQIVAPAEGHIAFAGVYRGYGHIVIVQHDGGWSSLVTGLGRTDVGVGDKVVQGGPLGVAEAGHPRVMIELRKDGAPLNPMEFLRP